MKLILIRRAIWIGLAVVLDFAGFAASGDKTQPLVSILEPVTGTRLTNEVVAIKGRASDNVNVTRVEVSVDGIRKATSDVISNGVWQVSVALGMGSHQVSVESFDAAGNRSLRAYVGVTRIRVAPFQLAVDPGGEVKGASNGIPLEIGKRYTLTAVPENGYLFTGWSGSVTSSVATITVLVPEGGLNLRAMFVPSVFTGLFITMGDDQFDPNAPVLARAENSGFFTMTRTAKGIASGKVLMQNRTYAFSGKMIGADGTAKFDVPRAGTTPLHVQFAIIDNENFEGVALQGKVSDGSNTFSADLKANIGLSQKNGYAGKYTFEVNSIVRQGTSDSPIDVTKPVGSGIGTIAVGASSGLVTVTLPEGTTVAINASLCQGGVASQDETQRDGLLPIYAPLQAGRGVFVGWLLLISPNPFGPRNATILNVSTYWVKALDAHA